MSVRDAGCRLAVALALCGAGSAGAQSAPGPLVLVLPFENTSGEPRLDWLREGMALHLTDAMATDVVATVPREERLRAFERLNLPPYAALSRASEIKAGQVAAATGVVQGRFVVVENQLTVSARLIHLGEGVMGPEVTARGPLSALFTTLDTLAGELGITPSRSEGRWPPAVMAFASYVRGITADSPGRGAVAFTEALTAAPDYDRARLALWRALTDEGAHQRAHDVAVRMRAGSPLASEAKFLAALSLMSLKRFDDALRALQALASSTPLASVSNAMGVAELRRTPLPQPARAKYYFSQAKDADTEDGDLFFNLGYAYYLDHDPRAAMYWLREAVRRNPGDGEAHGVLSAALADTGAEAEAGRERELAMRLLPASAVGGPWRAGGGDPVPRGLERLNVQFERRASVTDALAAGNGQRDQASMAQFHLDAGRRAFARLSDREAIQSLRRALFLSPYLAEAHLLLGRVYLRGGRHAEAIDAFKIGIWSEDTAEARVALAEAYLQAQDEKAAAVEIARALQIDAQSPAALALKARLTRAPW